jgi:acyl carrier protein
MTREEILACVLEALRNVFDVAAEAAVPAARLEEDLDFDSIDAVALVTRLEQETGLLLKEEGLRGLRTVQDIADVVFELQGQQRP